MRRLVAATATFGIVLAGALPAAAEPADPVEDVTPPRIEITAPTSPWEGWYAGDVAVHIKAVDDLGPVHSGVDFVEYELTGATAGSGRVDAAEGSVLTISNAGVTLIKVTAYDNDGNVATRNYGVGIDRAAPTVSFGGRLASADRVFQYDEQVQLVYTCTDDRTAVDTCAGPVASGQLLDTGTLGEHNVTVETRDRVGNTRRASISYTVAPNTFTVQKRAEITGTPRPGETLTAVHAEFSPTPSQLGYRWFRDGAYTGVADETYHLTAADIGTTIYVLSIATRPGWAQGTSMSDFAEVTGEIQIGAEPTLAGEPRLGKRLRIEHGAVTPATAAVSYSWYRDETPIGWTGASYDPAPVDLGHRISGRVTLTAAGYTTRTLSTSTSDPVLDRRRLEVSGAPTISGETHVGGVLTLAPPTIREPRQLRAPGDTANLTYQWLREDSPVAGATANTYRLGPADAGRRISVRVTGNAPGYDPVVVTSVATAPTAAAVPVVEGKVSSLGGRNAKIRVTVTVPGLEVDGTVTVRRGKKMLVRKALRGGTLTAKLSRQPNRKVTYIVTYSGAPGIAPLTVKIVGRPR